MARWRWIIPWGIGCAMTSEEAAAALSRGNRNRVSADAEKGPMGQYGTRSFSMTAGRWLSALKRYARAQGCC